MYGSATGAQADDVHSDHVPAECGAGHSVVGVVLDRQEGRASQSRSHHHHHPRPDHPHHRNCQQVRQLLLPKKPSLLLPWKNGLFPSLLLSPWNNENFYILVLPRRVRSSTCLVITRAASVNDSMFRN